MFLCVLKRVLAANVLHAKLLMFSNHEHPCLIFQMSVFAVLGTKSTVLSASDSQLLSKETVGTTPAPALQPAL